MILEGLLIMVVYFRLYGLVCDLNWLVFIFFFVNFNWYKECVCDFSWLFRDFFWDFFVWILGKRSNIFFLGFKREYYRF